jgi:hypothetical protein
MIDITHCYRDATLETWEARFARVDYYDVKFPITVAGRWPVLDCNYELPTIW